MQAEICNFKHVSVIPGIFLKININIFPFICLYSVFICEKLTFQKSFPASSPEKESVISRIQMRKRTTKKKIFFSPGTGTYPAPLRRRSSRRNKYRLLSISFFHPFPSLPPSFSFCRPKTKYYLIQILFHSNPNLIWNQICNMRLSGANPENWLKVGITLSSMFSL